MKESSRVLHWTWKIVKIAIVVEVVYVVLVNALLQIPFTQTAINMIKPEKFYIRWENAWTLYPFRVHVSGGFANGSASSQLWQVEVDSASGSINLLPLILKRVPISNVQAENVDYRQRPRPKPGMDFSRIEAFFPEIEGREATPAVPPPDKRPWRTTLRDAEVSGELNYWIFNLRGSASGRIAGEMEVVAPGGDFELDVDSLELDLGRHSLNEEYVMFEEGRFSGSMGFAPFKPREDKGIKVLDFFRLDLETDIDVNSLRFINLFLLDVEPVRVNGSGSVNGRLHFAAREVLEGTDLAIESPDLRVRVFDHLIEGVGTVDLALGEETGGQLDLRIHYDGLAVRHQDDEKPLMTGEDLLLKLGGDGKLRLDLENIDESRVAKLTVDQLFVPDIEPLQRYLPAGAPFRFSGGESRFSADVTFGPYDAEGWAKLVSKGVAGHVEQQDIRADMQVDVNFAGGRPVELLFDVSGTRVELDNVYVVGEERDFDDEGWAASLVFTHGEAELLDPLRIEAEMELAATDSKPIVAMFENQEGWRPNFIARALTTENIRGTGEMVLANERMLVPEAYMTSDNIEIGTKGLITAEGHDMLIYLKYKKLGALLKMNQDGNNLDIIGARKKYDAYQAVP